MDRGSHKGGVERSPSPCSPPGMRFKRAWRASWRQAVGDSDVGDSSGFYALWILMALVVTWDKLERKSTYPVTRTRRGATVPARSVIDYQKWRYQGTGSLNRSIWPHLRARQNNKGSSGWLSVLIRLVEMCVWLGSTPLVPRKFIL